VNARLALLFLLCLVCLTLLGQETPAQALAPQATSAVVEGQVINAATGAPLKKVYLVLRNSQGREPAYGATSDAAGRFAFKDVEPGQYRLWAMRTGYARQEYGARGASRAGTTLSVEAGQPLSSLVFRLQPQGVMAGTVTDEDGEPVRGAQVQAMRYGYVERRRQMYPAGWAETNDLGAFRLFGLSPGRYYISANLDQPDFRWGPRARREGESRQELGYAPTYYPGTVDAGAAAQIEVAPGSEVRGLQFALQRVPTVRIRGKVTNLPSKRPGRGAFVYLQPRGSARFGFMFEPGELDPEGNFEIRGVGPGSYTVTAGYQEGERLIAGRKQVEVTGADVDGVLIEIGEGLELTGTVRVEGAGEADFGEMFVGLEAESGGDFGRISAPVKPDGSFLLHRLLPDRYTFDLHGAPKGHYLKSVKLGTEEVLETGFELAGGAAGHLDVLLSGNGASIDGSVLNERRRAVRGAQVVLVPEPRRRSQFRLFRNTTTDQTGKFTLDAVAPGEYAVFAFDEVEGESWLDPDFLKMFEKLGAPVRLAERSRETLQLDLIRTAPPAEAKPTAPAKKGRKP